MKTLVSVVALTVALVTLPHDGDAHGRGVGFGLSFGIPYTYSYPPPVVYAPPPAVIYAPPPVVAANPTAAYCREYQTQALVAGRTRTIYGIACQQPDGTWQVMR
jgi:hypothetical protein